jgi:riboflavin synthase
MYPLSHLFPFNLLTPLSPLNLLTPLNSPMFTGIIEATAPILERSLSGLKIQRPALFDDTKIGSSICVSGVCLSVTDFDDESMTFDVVEETWERSNLGNLQEGSKVNLERALSVNGRFEGHIVQGHVEGVGRTSSVEHRTSNAFLTVALLEDMIKNCVQKGSIALDGVSLTIASIEGTSVTVALIPHTLEHSTLGLVQEGDSMNVETDVLGRYVRTIMK